MTRVALRDDSVADERCCLRRNRHVGVAREDDLPRKSSRVHVDVAICQRAGDDAVVVVGESCRRHNAHAAAGRAPFVVRRLDVAAVQGFDEALRFDGRLVKRSIGEVDDLLRMTEGKHPVRAVSCVVACVGRGRRVSQAKRDLHVAVTLDRTSEAAVTDNEQFAVPGVGRQPQLAVDVGVGRRLQRQPHAAVLRDRFGRRWRGRTATPRRAAGSRRRTRWRWRRSENARGHDIRAEDCHLRRRKRCQTLAPRGGADEKDETEGEHRDLLPVRRCGGPFG